MRQASGASLGGETHSSHDPGGERKLEFRRIYATFPQLFFFFACPMFLFPTLSGPKKGV